MRVPRVEPSGGETLSEGVVHWVNLREPVVQPRPRHHRVVTNRGTRRAHRPLEMSQGPTYSGFRNTVRPHEERTVTTLKDRPNTALLVIDVQNGVVANAHDRDGVIA